MRHLQTGRLPGWWLWRGDQVGGCGRLYVTDCGSHGRQGLPASAGVADSASSLLALDEAAEAAKEGPMAQAGTVVN